MNKKSTGLLLSILGVISLVLITAGVTYAFFSYTKEGLTENTITTGTITFYYDELNAEGSSISITEALPMSDSDGMTKLTATDQYFDFKVTSEVTGNTSIPYEVTVRKKAGSTLANNQIKVYLEATGTEIGTNHTVTTTDEGSVVSLFSDLEDASISSSLPEGTVEKTIFNGTVPAKSTAEQKYVENFKLRMWIKDDGTDGNSDYSPLEFKSVQDGSLITSKTYYGLSETIVEGNNNDRSDYTRINYVAKADSGIAAPDTENGETNDLRAITTEQYNALTTETEKAKYEVSEQFYPLNGQKFSVTVNVYANTTVITKDGE